MRVIAQNCFLGVLIITALQSGHSATPVVPAAESREPSHPRILVGFLNEPLLPPGPAGTTGWRYDGSGYRLSQSTFKLVQQVAESHSLRIVASWPAMLLAVDCVIYEIADDRPVSIVLAALANDSRIVFAQPVQEFYTPTDVNEAGRDQ
jgi:hypothetical protein